MTKARRKPNPVHVAGDEESALRQRMLDIAESRYFVARLDAARGDGDAMGRALSSAGAVHRLSTEDLFDLSVLVAGAPGERGSLAESPLLADFSSEEFSQLFPVLQSLSRQRQLFAEPGFRLGLALEDCIRNVQWGHELEPELAREIDVKGRRACKIARQYIEILRTIIPALPQQPSVHGSADVESELVGYWGWCVQAGKLTPVAPVPELEASILRRLDRRLEGLCGVKAPAGGESGSAHGDAEPKPDSDVTPGATSPESTPVPPPPASRRGRRRSKTYEEDKTIYELRAKSGASYEELGHRFSMSPQAARLARDRHRHQLSKAPTLLT